MTKETGSAAHKRFAESIQVPTKRIQGWRESIFNAVADRICDTNLPVVQRAIGMWSWHTGINIPLRRNVNVLGEGAMSIRVPIGSQGEHIYFSVWMFLGEVRIGVRVPNRMLAKAEQVKTLIETCYDGKPCDRINPGPEATFFDWIFRDRGVAHIDTMVASLDNPLIQAGITDGVANLLTHFYMATINALVSSGVMMVSRDEGLQEQSKMQQYVVEVYNIPENVEQRMVHSAIAGMGIHVDAYYPQGAERSVYLISMPLTDSKDAVEVAISNCMSLLKCETEIREADSLEITL